MEVQSLFKKLHFFICVKGRIKIVKMNILFTPHGKDCQGRKKVQRNSKTKYNQKFTIESNNQKSEMI